MKPHHESESTLRDNERRDKRACGQLLAKSPAGSPAVLPHGRLRLSPFHSLSRRYSVAHTCGPFFVMVSPRGLAAGARHTNRLETRLRTHARNSRVRGARA